MTWDQLVEFLKTPTGAALLSVVGYLVAKRFPAFQALVWALLDVLKITRPNGPPPVPAPSPAPTPAPTPGPGPGPVPDPVPDLVALPLDLGGLLSTLVSQLIAKRQHGAALAVVELAKSIDLEPAKGSE